MKFLLLPLLFFVQIATADQAITMVKVDKVEANRICGHFNWFVWWSCREEIEGFTLQSDVLNWVLKLRDNTDLNAESLKAVFRAANGGKYDSDALDFLTQQGLLTVGSMPEILIAMKDGKYDLDFIKLCNSRNSVMSVTNPILSARRLNQPAILNCVQMFKDVPATTLNKAKIAPCRLRPEIVDRNICLAPVLKDIKAGAKK